MMIDFALTTLKDRLERFRVFKKHSFSLFDGCLKTLFSIRVEILIISLL